MGLGSAAIAGPDAAHARAAAIAAAAAVREQVCMIVISMAAGRIPAAHRRARVRFSAAERIASTGGGSDPRALEEMGIGCQIPAPPARARIHEIIFSELVYGILKEPSRLFFNDVVAALRNGGCDAAVLGCTEIPLIVDPARCPLPTLDSTRLLARAALQEAMRSS